MDTRLSRLAALAVAGMLVFAACDDGNDDPTAEPEAADEVPVATPLAEDDAPAEEQETE